MSTPTAIAAAVLTAATLSAPTLAGTVVLDNTAGLSGSAPVGGGSLNSYRRAFEFQTGAFAANLESLTIALTAQHTTYTGDIVFRLLQTSGNAWTGTELASTSFTRTLEANSTDWYSFDVTASLGVQELAANTNYSIVFESANWPTNNAFAPEMGTLNQPFDSAGGFSLVSTGYGGVGSTPWYADVSTPAIQIGIQQSLTPAVPGVGGLATIAGAGLAGRRRRR